MTWLDRALAPTDGTLIVATNGPVTRLVRWRVIRDDYYGRPDTGYWEIEGACSRDDSFDSWDRWFAVPEVVQESPKC